MLKSKLKLLLQYVSRCVNRQPWLKRMAIGVLEHFPRLRAWLFQIMADGAISYNYTAPIVPADLAHLTPHARHIYADLKTAIERQQKECD